MTHYLSGSIRTDKQGLEKLIEIYHIQPTNNEIEIDMSSLNFLDANLIALFGAILLNKASENILIKITNIKDAIEDILKRNHFLGSENEYFSPFETAMEFKQFKSNEDIEFIEYVSNQLLNKSDFPKMEDDYKKRIRSKIQELFANAKEHGNAESIFCCGQHFPREKLIKFTMVNLGTTIKENVNKFLNESKEAYEAIEWASKEGHSTASSNDNPTRGLGLSLLHDFVLNNNGKLSILSDDGYWYIANGKSSTDRVQKKFLGTIINLTVNVNDKKKHKMPSLKDLGWIFNKACTNGDN